MSRFAHACALSLLAGWLGCANGLGADGDGPAGTDATAPDAAAGDAAPTPDAEVGACDPDLAGQHAPLGELRADQLCAAVAPSCLQAEHFAVAAGGQRLAVAFQGLSAPVTVTVLDALGGQLASAALAGPAGSVELTAEVTGEVRVLVGRADLTAPLSYEARLHCLEQCDLEATRYPILLVHGAGGADYFGLLDYFYDVEATLEGYGYLPYAPAVTAMGHSEVRAADLAAAIDDVLAETGARKVHLIGHSQAGLDFRVLLGGLGYGDRVATATSLSTPHAGYRPGLAEASAWFGMRTDAAYLTGEFSALYPEDPSVLRFSWAAATCGAMDYPCLARYDGEVVAAQLAATYQTMRVAYLDDAYGGDNDGVVPVSATQWGTFLGVLAADHWDEVGQIPLQRLGPFDHLQFYLDEARRLRALEREHAL